MTQSNLIASLSPKPSRRGRRIVLSVALAMSAICAAWIIVWFVVANATEAEIRAWMLNERISGRTVQCERTSVKGFPLRIEFHCQKPTFAIHPNGIMLHGTSGDLVASAQIYRPHVITAKLQSPLIVSSHDGRPILNLTWETAEAVIETADEGVKAATLNLARSVAIFHAQYSEPIAVNSQALQANLRQQAGTANSPSHMDLRAEVLDIRSQRLDLLTGDDRPAQIRVASQIFNADFNGAQSLSQAIELWRRSNGRLAISDAHFNKGNVSIAGRGAIALDQSRRIQGNISFEALNLAPVAQRLGIPMGAIVAGNLLSGLLGGPRKETDNSRSDSMRFTIKMENGRLLIGSFPTPILLTPLY